MDGVDAMRRSAVRLVSDHGVGGGAASTACVLGTTYGTAHVAERILRTIDDRGPRFLDPESFLFFAPHGVTSSIGIAAGLGGLAATFVGADAGATALLVAATTVATGRHPAVLCGAFDWPSPFGAAAIADLAGEAPPHQGGFVLVLVEDRGSAERRGAPILGTICIGGKAAAPPPSFAGHSPAVRSLAAVADALDRRSGPVSVPGAPISLLVEPEATTR
jgi:3-oxoacyl-(acyl-carrier-protein) synthase